MLCYLTYVMFCYITRVMLYNMRHVMLYNTCLVMLYNMCHVLLYNIRHVMLYNTCLVMLYKKNYRSEFLQSSFIFVIYLLKEVYRKIMSEIHFVGKTRYEDLTETGC